MLCLFCELINPRLLEQGLALVGCSINFKLINLTREIPTDFNRGSVMTLADIRNVSMQVNLETNKDSRHGYVH